jgi:hypothetical protein
MNLLSIFDASFLLEISNIYLFLDNPVLRILTVLQYLASFNKSEKVEIKAKLVKK